MIRSPAGSLFQSFVNIGMTQAQAEPRPETLGDARHLGPGSRANTLRMRDLRLPAENPEPRAREDLLDRGPDHGVGQWQVLDCRRSFRPRAANEASSVSMYTLRIFVYALAGEGKRYYVITIAGGDRMEPGATRFCARCGSQRIGTHRFCTVCGAEFPDLDQQVPLVTAAESATSPAAPDPDGAHPDATFKEPGDFTETMAAQPQRPVAEPLHAERGFPEPAHAEPPAGGPGHADDGGDPGWANYPRPVQRPPTTRNKVILTGTVAVLVLGVAGGAYVVATAHSHGKAVTAPTGIASAATSKLTPASAVPTSTAPSASASFSSTASSGTTVAVAPSAADNLAAPQVTALLNRYFTAINQLDYSTYASLFDQQLQQPQPESSFDAGYTTTVDSAILLTSISDAGSGGLAASVTFSSQQDPVDSPDNSSCDQWWITLFLVPDGTGYLIGPPPPGYHASYQAC